MPSLSETHFAGETTMLSRNAVTNGAELILADAPTTNLETGQGLEIISFIHTSVKNDNCSVVIASHDERIIFQTN